MYDGSKYKQILTNFTILYVIIKIVQWLSQSLKQLEHKATFWDKIQI